MKKKSKNITQGFCELPLKHTRGTYKNRNRLYRFKKESFSWNGIRVQPYKPGGDDWQKIIRQVIIGSHGESTRFHLRYFEISPGGNSSFETHKHEHVVICIRGKGRVRLGKRTVEMGYMDVLYISPETPHQLMNPYDEPFGFFCIVNARRDKPKPVNKAP
ncbi:MAG: cupin domain-containing protein [Nitrospirae bacterium]|nr:cupin domain-containing protein [Nitrospirota bacterium]